MECTAQRVDPKLWTLVNNKISIVTIVIVALVLH